MFFCYLQPAQCRLQKLKVFLVGTDTFGKGSVQELIPIKNGCALKLTTQLYYLPVNNLIQVVGIKPDFTVTPKVTPEKEMKWINVLYGKESSLKGHITVKEVKAQANISMINLLQLARRCRIKQIATREGAVEFLRKSYMTDDKIKIVKIR